MTNKKDETPEGGPCPPVKETDADQEDNVLANENDADYDADETEQEATA
jgi:hypothetical protein